MKIQKRSKRSSFVRQNRKKLVLRNGTKREEVCEGIAKLAKTVNRKHPPSALVHTRAKVGIDAIGVEFSWRNTDEEQDLEVQEKVRKFALNGFADEVRNLLSENSNWKDVAIQRRGRKKGGKNYICLITAR